MTARMLALALIAAVSPIISQEKEVAPMGPVPPPDPSDFVIAHPQLPQDAPGHITDAYPLSDQQNEGGWVRYEPMSDEFEGDTLDDEKWWPKNPQWLGRKPGYFWTENVQVSDGKLHLTMRKNEPEEMPKDRSYHTYTSAAVKSKGTVKYGYFEVRAKPMRSAGSSSFWFYHNEKDWWTEIDVYEIGGGAPKWKRRVNMNLHVFHTPWHDEHWARGSGWQAPFDLADDYHVYGLQWTEHAISYFFDGCLLRRGPNTHWHQALTLNFDSETMPNWFGLPDDQDLPSTYSIEYVRAWKQQTQQ